MRARSILLFSILALAAAPAAAVADGGPIMPLSQVHAGLECTGQTVIQGTTISSFAVHVLGVVQASGEGPRILVSVSGPAVDATGIAEGFSGSPVYCPGPDGTQENAGAISEGVGAYGNMKGLVTPIEQMLGEPVKPPPDTARLTARTHPLAGPLAVSGLSPALFGVLEQAAERAGRQVVAAAPQPFTNFPVQSLIPGASVAISYSTGTIGTGAIGTVTYRDGQNVYAFGHPLDGAGRRSLLLQDAYVYDVINNPDPLASPSYKLAAPGHVLGTFTSDTPNTVIGQLGSQPSTTPVAVTAHDLDTGGTLVEQTQVADETDIGQPLGVASLSTVAPLAIGQAATDVYNGPPANESGRLCLRVSLRESRSPLQFCNRYVGTGGSLAANSMPPELTTSSSSDAATALSLLDAETFGRVHVTGVAATLWAQRGLAMGQILDARGPSRARAGATIRVRLRVRRYRSGISTISFTLHVPAGDSGPLEVAIHGAPLPAPPSTGGGLSSLLTVSLGGGGAESPSAPDSLDALRRDFAAVGTYDGLRATFNGHHAVRVYRDPKLLITGSAKLALLVGK